RPGGRAGRFTRGPRLPGRGGRSGVRTPCEPRGTSGDRERERPAGPGPVADRRRHGGRASVPPARPLVAALTRRSPPPGGAAARTSGGVGESAGGVARVGPGAAPGPLPGRDVRRGEIGDPA